MDRQNAPDGLQARCGVRWLGHNAGLSYDHTSGRITCHCPPRTWIGISEAKANPASTAGFAL